MKDTLLTILSHAIGSLVLSLPFSITGGVLTYLYFDMVMTTPTPSLISIKGITGLFMFCSFIVGGSMFSHYILSKR